MQCFNEAGIWTKCLLRTGVCHLLVSVSGGSTVHACTVQARGIAALTRV